MPAPLVRRVLPAVAALSLPLGVTTAAQAVGPMYPHDTILNGQYTFIPLPDQAMITREQYGYRFRAGQQDSDLVVKRVSDGLRFHDRGTRSWKSLDSRCRRVSARRGVAAVCTVPRSVSRSSPMLVEIWPRLGDDRVDTSALPAAFQVAALVDAGVDQVYLGAGDDFVNGAMDRDVVRGGAGDDWIRTGDGNDDIGGGSGHDKLVGSGGRDVVRGGSGQDRVDGGDGRDQLYAGDTHYDVVACGGGLDRAWSDRADRTSKCERLTRQ